LQSPVVYYASLILIPFVGTVMLTPLASKLAFFFNILDEPGRHKIHLENKPMLGGVAVFACFALTVLSFCRWMTGYIRWS